MAYQTLNSAEIVKTLVRLTRRIDERFPERGLGEVCRELLNVAKRDRKRAAAAARPYLLVRVGVALVIAAGLALVGWAAASSSAGADGRWLDLRGLGAVQTAEAAVNLLVLVGAGVFFLTTAEERLKRRRVLDDLHELRSFAHVVDMHQLTKDPTVTLNGARTQSSPEREMSEFELTRYLDYCAEMLSLIGKLAALYAQHVRDPVVINAVNDVESLTTNLSRKIWQKIMLLRQFDESAGAPR